MKAPLKTKKAWFPLRPLLAFWSHMHLNVLPLSYRTIYSVSVPVKRVKAQALAALGQGEEVSLEWDTEAGLPSYDSDPASRFPYGC